MTAAIVMFVVALFVVSAVAFSEAIDWYKEGNHAWSLVVAGLGVLAFSWALLPIYYGWV